MVAAEWDWYASLMASTVLEDACSMVERFDQQRPAWQKKAACRGLDVRVFFSDDSSSAVAVCAGCPVAIPCGAYGASERFGTWGGIDAAERVRQARRAWREARRAG